MFYDEKLIVKGMRFSLEQDGMEVDCAYDGEEAINLAKQKEYDVVLLDVMLPKFDGYEVCQAIREFSEMPIIMLTAKGNDMDKILGLEYGADDYITKPFEKDEVLARVGAVLRRSWDRGQGPLSLAELNDGTKNLDPCPCSTFVFKQLTLKPASREVYVQGNMLSLTSHEFDILSKLLQFPDRVFTKAQLYQDIWKSGYYGEDNTINVHISNLRKKIKEFDDTSYVKTVWGIGFKIDNE